MKLLEKSKWRTLCTALRVEGQTKCHSFRGAANRSSSSARLVVKSEEYEQVSWKV